jgi:hypothetical protein
MPQSVLERNPLHAKWLRRTSKSHPGSSQVEKTFSAGNISKPDFATDDAPGNYTRWHFGTTVNRRQHILKPAP